MYMMSRIVFQSAPNEMAKKLIYTSILLYAKELEIIPCNLHIYCSSILAHAYPFCTVDKNIITRFSATHTNSSLLFG